MAQRRFAAPDTCVGQIETGKRYATDATETVRTLLDAARPRQAKSSRICELGFGSGWLLEEMAREYRDEKLFGLDLSPGMATHVQHLLGGRVAVTVGDMERLPFRDGAFDAIVTCWTLYFVGDIDGALQEIKRCLKPGARLVAATNAPGHMAEYDEMEARALRSVLGRKPDADVTRRFDLDTGEAYMRRHFGDVEVRHWRGSLVLPEVEPLLRLWDAWRPEWLVGSEAERARAEFERLAQDWLRRDGEIRISRHGGAFVGTK
jgi:SAM-dependent methyltransferase